MFAICTVNRLRSAFKVDDTQTAEAMGYIVINKASLAVSSRQTPIQKLFFRDTKPMAKKLLLCSAECSHL